jgi:Bacterial protein of unknown function (DUF885)
MSAFGQRFLDHHVQFRPVDGSFMGRRECDAQLPRADRTVLADESRAIGVLLKAAAQAPRDELRLAARSNAERPRLANPAWYSGEATFGLVALLLPQSAPLDARAVAARLSAVPDFLSDARTRLAEAGAAPAGWCERACREARALVRFLEGDLQRVAGADASWREPARRAAQALTGFADAVSTLPDRNPAAGGAYLEQVMQEIHGLAGGPADAAAEARRAFDRLSEELVEDAARLTPACTWQAAIESLSRATPAADGVLEAFRDWDGRAIAAATAAQLVTPAESYALDYRLLDAPFRQLAPDSYFLFYRSPPALRPGAGSVYWVAPPGADTDSYLRSQNIAVIKTTHTVHHGSIGHHTQNARARQAPGVLGRLAGTDCASGVALLSAGTMVEGWACYAEELLREAGGFYAGAELLLLKQNERRNAASVLVDVNLHTGAWSLSEAQRFYRDEAGFPAQRVTAEVVRNSMFPGSRLMYRAGVEAIKALRRASTQDTRRFHDTLLGFGHVPVAAAAAEMARPGQPA